MAKTTQTFSLSQQLLMNVSPSRERLPVRWQKKNTLSPLMRSDNGLISAPPSPPSTHSPAQTWPSHPPIALKAPATFATGGGVIAPPPGEDWEEQLR